MATASCLRRAVCALGSHKWDKDLVCERLSTFWWERFPRQSLDFSKNCAGISCFITYMKSIFFAIAYSSGARNSSWVVEDEQNVHTCTAGSICLSTFCTDFFYGLWNHHPLLSLRFWPTLWTYYTVKPFSLPLSTKVWPIHVNHYRKASCDQKLWTKSVMNLDWIWRCKCKRCKTTAFSACSLTVASSQIRGHTSW